MSFSYWLSFYKTSSMAEMEINALSARYLLVHLTHYTHAKCELKSWRGFR